MTNSGEPDAPESSNQRWESRDSFRIQLQILYWLGGFFALGAIVLTGDLLYVGAGLLVPVLAAQIGRRLKGRSLGFWEPMAIWGVGSFAVFVASTTARFPMTEGTMALVALNSFVIVGAWAVHRVPSQEQGTRSGLFSAVRESIVVGIAMGVGLSLIASVIFGIATLSGTDDPMMNARSFALIVGAYLAGGASGGLVVGILRPLTRWPLGLMCVGIPVATLVYGSMGIAMFFLGDPEGPTTLSAAASMALGIGAVVGPVGGLVFRGQASQWPPL